MTSPKQSNLPACHAERPRLNSSDVIVAGGGTGAHNFYEIVVDSSGNI